MKEIKMNAKFYWNIVLHVYVIYINIMTVKNITWCITTKKDIENNSLNPLCYAHNSQKNTHMINR